MTITPLGTVRSEDGAIFVRGRVWMNCGVTFVYRSQAKEAAAYGWKIVDDNGPILGTDDLVKVRRDPPQIDGHTPHS